MRAGYEAVIDLNLKKFSPETAKKKHIEIAKKILNQFVSRENLSGVEYQIFVDGVLTSTEDSVRPFGVIKYVFLRMSVVGKYAISQARALSPVRSGRYKRSWILVADGELKKEDQISNNTKELILVNNQPYARKIHMRGARFRGVPPGIVEKVRQLIMRRFKGSIKVELRFIELHGAYLLRKDYVQVRKSGRLRVRDRAGTEITYPALIIRPRFDL